MNKMNTVIWWEYLCASENNKYEVTYKDLRCCAGLLGKSAVSQSNVKVNDIIIRAVSSQIRAIGNMQRWH